MSEEETVALNLRNMDYDVMASLKESGNHSTALELAVSLKRKLAKSIVQIIASPGLLVTVSWVSSCYAKMCRKPTSQSIFDLSR